MNKPAFLDLSSWQTLSEGNNKERREEIENIHVEPSALEWI